MTDVYKTLSLLNNQNKTSFTNFTKLNMKQILNLSQKLQMFYYLSSYSMLHYGSLHALRNITIKYIKLAILDINDNKQFECFCVI